MAASAQIHNPSRFQRLWFCDGCDQADMQPEASMWVAADLPTPALHAGQQECDPLQPEASTWAVDPSRGGQRSSEGATAHHATGSPATNHTHSSPLSTEARAPAAGVPDAGQAPPLSDRYRQASDRKSAAAEPAAAEEGSVQVHMATRAQSPVSRARRSASETGSSSSSSPVQVKVCLWPAPPRSKSQQQLTRHASRS